MSFSPLTTLGILENQNYIINSDFNSFPFASNATFGWSLRNGGTPDATSKLPTSAPTGSPAGTLALAAASGGSQISGTVSARLSSTAATTAGDMMITDALALDAKVRSTVLSFSFSYSVTSNGTGTPNFSGTSANAIGVAIYDVTNNQWIQPAGVFNLVQSSGVGKSSGSFQVPSNCTSVRLAVYFPNSTAASGGSPFTVIFDDFVLSPQAIPTGAAISDWASYNATATGLGTGSANVFGKFRRVGDSYEIEGYIQATVAGSGASGVTLSLPGSIDLSKLSNLSNGFATLGVANFFNGATNNYSDQWTVIYDGNINQVRVIKGGTATLLVGSDLTLNSRIVLNFKIPVVGLSSNTVLSQDTDTRVVAFSGFTTASTAFTGTITKLPMTASADSHAGWSVDEYTVPVSGFYKITSNLPIYSPGGTGNAFARIYIDGTSVNTSYQATQFSGETSLLALDWEQFVNAGQKISIRISNSTGVMSLLGAVVGATATLSINRLSGPATIAASESVIANYYTVGGAGIPLSGTALIYGTRNFDSHSAYNPSTGIFTAPVSGKYLVSAQYSNSSSSIGSFYIQVIKQASLYSEAVVNRLASVSSVVTNPITALVDLNAGQTCQINYYATIASQNLTASAPQNNIQIVRVGN